MKNSTPSASPRKSVGAPNPASLMAQIRFLAEDSGKVIFGDHAFDRVAERSITTEDVYRVLRLGEAAEPFTPGVNPGEWKTKVVAKLKGSRKVGVATVILLDGYLFIKTVEWEDR